jgi:hypothetical protein
MRVFLDSQQQLQILEFSQQGVEHAWVGSTKINTRKAFQKFGGSNNRIIILI